MEDVRHDQRGITDVDLTWVHCPRSDLNTTQVTVEKIPRFAVTTGSQNPFGHFGIGLMKTKITPTCATHDWRVFMGIGLGHKPSAEVMTL
jgi:hypothetical protein